MTAKIDWYREVMELEPNSKLFFPLARLVAQEGNKDEAISILENGLVRHPEYLEARLFLIELLHQQNRREECNKEVARLGSMFASYGGFWQAWAACLASEECQAETASIIRFLAAHFVSGPLKLHDVINRGLDAMLKEGKLAEAAPERAIDHDEPAKSTAADFQENPDEMLEDLDATLAGVSEDAGSSDKEETEESNGEMEAAPLESEMSAENEAELPMMEEEPMAEEELAIGHNDPDIMMVPAMEEPEEALAEELAEEREVEIGDNDPDEDLLPVPEEADMPQIEQDAQLEEAGPAEQVELDMPEDMDTRDETDMPEAEPLSASEILDELPVMEEPDEELAIGSEDPDVDMLPASEDEFVAPSPEVSPEKVVQAEAELLAGLDLPTMESPEELEPEDELMEDEQISLRTRSMAEVLAEQGDIQGALEIYRELAQAATSADEEEDINRRIATLESRLSMANASATYSGVDAEAAARSKEKLIGMLEALAERVEARAEN